MNEQQQAVFDNVMYNLNQQRGKTTITVDADAGVGKTYVAAATVKGALSLGYHVAAIAFTNLNADEFAARVNDNRAVILTSHKLGMRQFPNGRVNVTDTVLDLYFKGQGVKNIKGAFRLLSLAKANLLTAAEQLHETVDRWQLKKISTNDIGVVHNALQMFNPKTPHVDDLIYYPSVKGWAKDQFDLIVVDEYQDQTPALLKMLDNLLSPNGVLLCVGDRKQAIFGFRGAYFQDIPNAVNYPITITYRHGQGICSFVNGEFGTNTSSGIDRVSTVNYVNEVVHDVEGMVVSRTNAALVPIAIKAIAQGQAVYLTNKYLLEKMLMLLLSVSHNETCPNCQNELVVRKRVKGWGDPYFLACGAWPKGCKKGHAVFTWDKLPANEVLTTVKATLLNNREDADDAGDVDRIDDEIAVFEWLLTNYSVGDAYAQLLKVSQSTGGMMLTTCHRAKGLEATNVYVLEKTFKDALNRAIDDDNPEQVKQEHNLRYVAYTRAKDNLYLVK